jgi:CxxC motif-containing protein
MTAELRRLTCIVCPLGCEIRVEISGHRVLRVEGNACPRGLNYATEECTSPKRSLTTLVRVNNGAVPVTSVRTTKPIPKGLLRDVHRIISEVVLEAPVHRGQLVLKDVLGTGADVIVTRSVKRISESLGNLNALS